MIPVGHCAVAHLLPHPELFSSNRADKAEVVELGGASLIIKKLGLLLSPADRGAILWGKNPFKVIEDAQTMLKRGK